MNNPRPLREADLDAFLSAAEELEKTPPLMEEPKDPHELDQRVEDPALMEDLEGIYR